MENLRTPAQNRKLYWLFGQLNIRDAEMISGIVYNATNGRTTHTSELRFLEAKELIENLSRPNKANKESKSERIERSTNEALKNELDLKRKGVIRAIFRWFDLQGRQVTIDYLKAVACRAAGADTFNSISNEALQRIYHEFCRKQKAQETMICEKSIAQMSNDELVSQVLAINVLSKRVNDNNTTIN